MLGLESKLMPRTAFALLLVFPALVQAESYTLERKLKKGQRIRVEERTHSELIQRYKGPNAAVGGEEVSEVQRIYVEEVRSVQPERLARRYELSTRAKYKPGQDPTPQRTSVHDRSVRLEGLAMHPEEPFEISKQDREALRWDRLAYALLPPQKVVERGDDWTLSSEAVGRALWGPYVASDNLTGSGARVQLRQVRKRQGQQVAVLKVKALLVHLEGGEQLPGVDLALRGELVFALEGGVLLEGSLTGTVEYTVRDKEKRTFSAEGPCSWSYAATLLESRQPRDQDQRDAGEPPPPGTTALVCEENPEHRLNLSDLQHCMQCGRALDREQGCEEHAWIAQHCPHDGAPFRPE